MNTDLAILIWSGIGKCNLIHPAKWIAAEADHQLGPLQHIWIGDQLTANCQTESASWASAWEQREKSSWLLRSLDRGFLPFESGWHSAYTGSCCSPSIHSLCLVTAPPFSFCDLHCPILRSCLAQGWLHLQLQEWAYEQSLINEILYALAHSDRYGGHAVRWPMMAKP